MELSLFSFIVIELYKFLYILNINALPSICLVNISLILEVVFLFFGCFFFCAKTLHFDVVPFVYDIFVVVVCTFDVISKNYCQDQYWGASLYFLLVVLCYEASYFPFLLSFGNFCEWWKSSVSFLCMCLLFPSTNCWTDYSFPTECSWLPCQILNDHICKALFLGSQFCSVGLCVYSIFMSGLYCFDYYSFEI